MKARKGFFFVLITLLILMYIVASLSVFTRTVEISEKRAAEKFKVSNLEAAVDQITNEKVQKLADISTYYALMKLNDHAAYHPVKEGEIGEWEFTHINASMAELVLNGKASSDHFVDGRELSIDFSLAEWIDKLNKSLESSGMRVSSFSAENFFFNQSDYDGVNYSFTLHLALEDNAGTASLSRTYDLKGEINIEGLIDPAIVRMGMENNLPQDLQKQIFFNEEYKKRSDMRPKPIEIGKSEGQGWFYGPLVEVANAKDVDPIERSQWILVGDYNDIISLKEPDVNYNEFGAYILTNKVKLIPECGGEEQSETFNPIVYDPKCDKKIEKNINPPDKPFAVIDGFKIGSLPEETKCPKNLVKQNSGVVRCVLFVAQYDFSEIKKEPDKKLKDVHLYGIEKLRDFAVCGYYVNSEEAPSYFQRLLNKSYSRSSPLGIETFLIGSFIGGKGVDAEGNPLVAYWDDSFSRLDTELAHKKTGKKIRGMPGCKEKGVCGSDSYVGHFTLGDVREDYLGEKTDESYIGCDDGYADCE